MANAAGRLTLRGRFQPGSTVRLVKVDGPQTLRPGPNDETVDTQTVDEDGTLTFNKGVSVGDRYFAVGQVNGQPLEVRLTGRSDDDPGHLAGYEPVSPDRTRLGIGGSGGWADEDPSREKGEEVPEGATWLAQHDVPKGTLQRSGTPRGAAAVISAEERERATKQWRKQEPTNPVVEATPDPQDEEARTAEQPDTKAAKATTGKGK
jgi:hypothetical protein